MENPLVHLVNEVEVSDGRRESGQLDARRHVDERGSLTRAALPPGKQPCNFAQVLTRCGMIAGAVFSLERARSSLERK
jgi:hypothetical protein